jgi:sec-independent protein translocase protein TatB
VFDLSVSNLLILGVLALILFGPDQLPKIAGQAGRALRDLRRIAESAKADLQEGLGPEFRDFDITDLHPKNFVRKHLWDEFDGTSNGGASNGGGSNGGGSNGGTTTLPDGTRVPGVKGAQVSGTDVASLLEPGESPPYDSEAT